MPETRIEKTIKRWERVKADQSNWFSLYDDLASVMLPRRLGFSQEVQEGDRRTDDIFDGTPMQGARMLANAIGGFLRPEGLPDADIKAEDDALNNMAEVQDWLGDSEERLKGAFNNPHARFRQGTGEADLDLVVFGTANLFEGESQKRNHLLFQSVHLKDAAVAFDEEGAPEAEYRKRMMPLRHLEARFGLNALSEATKRKLASETVNLDEKIAILHAIQPRQDGRRDAIFVRNSMFEDLWIELDAKHLIQEGGFFEFPFIVPRWDTSSGEDYGRSPGMIALPDADTLQAFGETILISGQRAADPPLAVPNDGTFDAINTFPGGLAYYDVETAAALRGRSPFFAIESGTQLPISRDMQQDTRQQVWMAFFRNVLNLPIEGPRMTATEVIARKEEFMREMGPIFGRLEADYTAPMVERAFMIMLRGGGFLPIPRALQDKNIRFEYDSPVRRVRQQVEAAAARMWAADMLELDGARPGAIDKASDLINTDELGRFSAEALGIPRRIVRSNEEVKKSRDQRAQAQQATEKMVALQQAADVAKAGGQAGLSIAKAGAQTGERNQGA